jgi:2-(1,2-epoxy-1,2-dihydrophenyl)acetyl-CoA isomerase
MSSLELETVGFEVREAVARVTLNRPEALNAWTVQLAHEMVTALDSCAADPEVRAVVITGAGRAFSSGTDLKASVDYDEHGKPDVITVLREAYNPLIMRVRELPKPVVAAVNGVSAGIGCSLALAADLIVAAESAYFLMAFANIGLALDGGASPLLVGRVGFARASEIGLLAERIPAAQALEWGLVNRVVADTDLLSASAAMAEKLAAGAPGSYRTIKQTINQSAWPDLAELMDREAVLQQERAASADFAEGITAFLQKRPAQFTGN